MSNRSWTRRSIEERTLLNPPFVARIIRAVADGYVAEADEGLPFPLLFLAVPAALHPQTRSAVPSNIRKSLRAWTLENSYLRETLALRAEAIAPTVREATVFALRGGLVALDGTALTAPPMPRLRSRPTDSEDVKTVLSRARFIGRWFAHGGDVATIYASWGVRP
jgi:hypothetical protein